MTGTLDQDPKRTRKIMQWYNVSQGGGLIVSGLASELIEIDSSPGMGHFTVFSGETLNSH